VGTAARFVAGARAQACAENVGQSWSRLPFHCARGRVLAVGLDPVKILLADLGKDFILLRSMRMFGPTVVSLLILVSLPPMIAHCAPLDARGSQFIAFKSFSVFKKSPGDQTGETVLTSPEICARIG